MSSRVELSEPLKHPLDEALSGEEIDSLRIKEEDLRMVIHLVIRIIIVNRQNFIKLHQPKPPAAARPEQTIRKVLLRKHKTLTKQTHKKLVSNMYMCCV